VLVCGAVPTALLQPDLLYWKGELREGLALAVGEDGRIRDVLPAAQAPHATRLPGRALLPGLVNAHSHAFQRLIRGRTEFVSAGHATDDFWSWRESMYQAATSLQPEELYVASRQAFLEMALAGITSVGEFHYLHHAPDGTPYEDRQELAHQVIRAARDVGLRICLLRVGYARAGFQVPANPRQRRFLDAGPEDVLGAVEALGRRWAADGCVSVGLAPHSVRAVPRPWLEAFGAYGGIVHMHVAEQPAEVKACQAEHGRTPVELLDEVGLLRAGFTAVHAVHVEAVDVTRLARGGAGVCACPSTERNLGDGVVPADAYVREGVPVCLGTDSQAAVDLVDEARQLEGHLRLVRLRRAVLDPGEGRRDGLARRLLEMATVHGARGLGLTVGELRPGAPADWFTVDLEDPSLAGVSREALLAALLVGGARALVREVVVDGHTVVSDGRHPLQARSREDFTALARRLFG
jgi:formimidoylglutamate deiminase